MGFVHSNSLDIFYYGNNVNRIRNRPLLLNHTFSKQILLVIRSDDLEIAGLVLSSSLQIILLISNHFTDHHKMEIPTKNVEVIQRYY